MTPYQAQRLRFGILAARHMLERWRMTDWQHDDLEGCKAAQWMVKDSQRAFDREYRRIQYRVRRNDLAARQAALRKLFRKEQM